MTQINKSDSNHLNLKPLLQCLSTVCGTVVNLVSSVSSHTWIPVWGWVGSKSCLDFNDFLKFKVLWWLIEVLDFKYEAKLNTKSRQKRSRRSLSRSPMLAYPALGSEYKSGSNPPMAPDISHLAILHLVSHILKVNFHLQPYRQVSELKNHSIQYNEGNDLWNS